MQELSSITARDISRFADDLKKVRLPLNEIISSSGFLVIGGGLEHIGQATVKEIFKRDPKLLHVVDISENNLGELVRDCRSSVGYGAGKFETYALDCGSLEFDALFAPGRLSQKHQWTLCTG